MLFATALTGRKLLNARYTDLLTTGKVAVARGDSYACGSVAVALLRPLEQTCRGDRRTSAQWLRIYFRVTFRYTE